MRELRRSFILLGIFTALAITLAFSTVGESAADSMRTASLQSSTMALTLSIDPVNIEPGQQATVSITLKNLSAGPLAPEVQIALPSSISTKLQELPSATIYNAQSGTISWQPVMPGNGSEVQLSLPVIAQVADVQTPEQTISASVRSGEAEIRQELKFWIGLTPNASIQLNPPQVSVGQPIQLVGSVTGPGPVAQLWSLGDGRIVEAQDPVVLYPAPGTYEVILQASTPVGVVTNRNTVTIVPQPIAKFSVSDDSPAVGAAVLFSNESGGEQPLSYLWDFGDGSFTIETSPVHAYQFAGSYEVRLSTTGPAGESEIAQTVVVGEMPVADFVMGEIVDAGTVIQGQAFADDSATTIRWDMGDGREYEGSVIEHVYWSAGEYLVSVTVVNDFGETLIQRWVQVNPGPLFLYLPLVKSAAEVPGAAETVVAQPAQLEQPPEDNVGPGEELPILELPDGLTPSEQLLAYINEARRTNGLPALNLVPELSVAAQSHADDMATNGFTSHTGSDGSVPALRVQWSGYPGGYAGEATAWGMGQAVEPVRFWLSSPGHRVILLDPEATDAGVGFSENFSAPSVWYWTAEFASLDLPVIRVPLTSLATPPPDPVLALLGPPRDSEFTLSADTDLIFTWSWPVPLEPDERFAIYLNSRGRTTQLGTVTEPQSDSQYHFTISAATVPAAPGTQQWYVILEDTVLGSMREESEVWPIVFLSKP